MSSAEARADALAAEAERVRSADTLQGTPWSSLFHAARTTKTDVNGGYSTVCVQYRATEGEVETHDKPVKTRQGEHLRGTDAWDGKVALPVMPFMPLTVAREHIAGQLKREERHLRKRAARLRDDRAD